MSNSATFSLAAVMVTVSAFFQLNPFGRRDGYWILSDLFNTPNLLIKSKKILNQKYNNILQDKNFSWSLQEQLIAMYGLLNTIFIFLFIAYIIVSQWSNFLKFPSTLLSAPVNLKNKSFEFLDQSFLLILIFYILIFNLDFRILNKNLPIWFKKMHQIVATNSILKN
jgi:putative peptide zinc metalloprotease protein